jgi:hypothetical protein
MLLIIYEVSSSTLIGDLDSHEIKKKIQPNENP